MGRFLEAVVRYYRRDIVDAGREGQFLILVAFLGTFLTVRAITHSIRHGRGSRFFRNMHRGDTHIHHLVWGILLLIVSGYLALGFDNHPLRGVFAVMYGSGLALTLDEFALWLHLEDVYWTKKGRRSIDIVLVTLAFLGLILIGLQFWLRVGGELVELVQQVTVG